MCLGAIYRTYCTPHELACAGNITVYRKSKNQAPGTKKSQCMVPDRDVSKEIFCTSRLVSQRTSEQYDTSKIQIYRATSGPVDTCRRKYVQCEIFQVDKCTINICTVRHRLKWTRVQYTFVPYNTYQPGQSHNITSKITTGDNVDTWIIKFRTVWHVTNYDTCSIKGGTVWMAPKWTRVQSKLVPYDKCHRGVVWNQKWYRLTRAQRRHV